MNFKIKFILLFFALCLIMSNALGQPFKYNYDCPFPSVELVAVNQNLESVDYYPFLIEDTTAKYTFEVIIKGNWSKKQGKYPILSEIKVVCDNGDIRGTYTFDSIEVIKKGNREFTKFRSEGYFHVPKGSRECYIVPWIYGINGSWANRNNVTNPHCCVHNLSCEKGISRYTKEVITKDDFFSRRELYIAEKGLQYTLLAAILGAILGFLSSYYMYNKAKRDEEKCQK